MKRNKQPRRGKLADLLFLSASVSAVALLASHQLRQAPAANTALLYSASATETLAQTLGVDRQAQPEYYHITCGIGDAFEQEDTARNEGKSPFPLFGTNEPFTQ